MACLVFEGQSRCVWCRESSDVHPYRWCRRCNGDCSTPDPSDRESQLSGRPSWQWRQHWCACGGGIVTMAGQPLSQNDRDVLTRSRRAVAA